MANVTIFSYLSNRLKSISKNNEIIHKKQQIKMAKKQKRTAISKPKANKHPTQANIKNAPNKTQKGVQLIFFLSTLPPKTIIF
ncbi:MAG: hypothetical protein IJV56_04765 [Neisseriaceae bacterium]|nr:hypothetical protein [Neisseriaceae bacterium]